MSEAVVDAAPAAQAPVPALLPHPEKREQAEKLVQEVLRLMAFPARLEVKDGDDGSISMALFFEGEAPSAPAGRRANVIDALQFIVNKVVNRPQHEKRWVNIGVGAHPEPRKPREERRPTAASDGAQTSGSGGVPLPAGPAARPSSSRPAMQRQRPAARPAAAAAPPVEPAESSLEVSEDAELSAAVTRMAERSAALGRFYSVAAMSPEDRARVLKAAGKTAGLTVKTEGEARGRRVTFVPEKPTPMPKKLAVPVFDEEDGDEDEVEPKGA